MPPSTCAKCRGFPASEGDSWCVGCTAWEALGRELTAHWENSRARRLGNNIRYQAAGRRWNIPCALYRQAFSRSRARASSSKQGETGTAEEKTRRRRKSFSGDYEEESEGEEEEIVERSPPRDADDLLLHRPQTKRIQEPGLCPGSCQSGKGLPGEREADTGKRELVATGHAREEVGSTRDFTVWLNGRIW